MKRMKRKNKFERKLKFRIWYKKDRVMSLGLDIWNLPDIDEIKNKKPILMQFTGLFDKNGEEIYEGDILESPPDDPKDPCGKRGDKHRWYEIIKFGTYDCDDGEHTGLYIYDPFDKERFFINQFFIEDDIIRGNIFENKIIKKSDTNFKLIKIKKC